MNNIESAFVGKTGAVRLCLVGLLTEGHILLEDAPGRGKTTLARAIARSVGLAFQRIQFTSDLLPSDVVGVSILDETTRTFEFQKGPVFANIVLADELNRTTPRTQSSLLECMNERQVTVDGETHLLPRPFTVIATQNPLEFEGTYPLPESQLDRFSLRLSIGPLDRRTEKDLLLGLAPGKSAQDLEAVITRETLREHQSRVKAVQFDESLGDYVLDIIEETRRAPELQLGASTRAGLHLVDAAKAHAVLDERTYVIPDDVKHLAGPVLAHRLIPKHAESAPAGVTNAVVHRILENVRVPA